MTRRPQHLSGPSVVFFGMHRSTRLVARSVSAHVLDPIRAAGAEVRVFLHTYNLTHAHNVRAGEHGVELEVDQWRQSDKTSHINTVILRPSATSVLSSSISTLSSPISILLYWNFVHRIQHHILAL